MRAPRGSWSSLRAQRFFVNYVDGLHDNEGNKDYAEVS